MMTETLSKDQILAALKGVRDPASNADIVSLGLVSEVVIHKGKVYFAISVDPARAGELEEMRLTAESVVKDLPGVEGVAVTLTADRSPGAGAPGRTGNGANGNGTNAMGPAMGPAMARSPRRRHNQRRAKVIVMRVTPTKVMDTRVTPTKVPASPRQGRPGMPGIVPAAFPG